MALFGLIVLAAVLYGGLHHGVHPFVLAVGGAFVAVIFLAELAAELSARRRFRRR